VFSPDILNEEINMFVHRLGQTKYNTIGICCLLAKQAGCNVKGKKKVCWWCSTRQTSSSSSSSSSSSKGPCQDISEMF